MYQLKPYQDAAVDAVMAEWEAGRRNVLVVVPTACDKTVIFSKIIQILTKGMGHRVLVLAHRDELLEQAASTLGEFGVACAGKGDVHVILDGRADALVMSKQAMANRLDMFPRDWFQEIVIDEAHHAVAPGYGKILRRFPGAKVLGVTATPERGDGQDIMSVFDSVAFRYTLAEAVEAKEGRPRRAGRPAARRDGHAILNQGKIHRRVLRGPTASRTPIRCPGRWGRLAATARSGGRRRCCRYAMAPLWRLRRG